ncbi:MAG TPA: ArsR family transcriptional regulator [Candidatus Bathyarchaeota archaeon]|nr:ArsR family transcriptional regulator [Candidatus Bathyarchaeota archaeon]
MVEQSIQPLRGERDGGNRMSEELQFRNAKELMEVLSMLANENRLKIISLLAEKPMYISEIKRKLGVSYALTHLYMSSLEKIGLVESRYETVTGEKSYVKKYYQLKPFKLTVTPQLIKDLMGG